MMGSHGQGGACSGGNMDIQFSVGLRGSYENWIAKKRISAGLLVH
jgi:hypothetical protein